MERLFDSLVPIMGIVFSFGIPGAIVLWVLYSRHKERMRLIEKGVTAQELKEFLATENLKKIKPSYSYLKFGLILGSLGLGIFVASVIENIYEISEGIQWGIILIFLGLGFLTYYLIVNTKQSGEKTDSKS
jgi:sulfite exporter TauE/SafE